MEKQKEERRGREEAHIMDEHKEPFSVPIRAGGEWAGDQHIVCVLWGLAFSLLWIQTAAQ